jgi:hypothetical protein
MPVELAEPVSGAVLSEGKQGRAVSDFGADDAQDPANDRRGVGCLTLDPDQPVLDAVQVLV